MRERLEPTPRPFARSSWHYLIEHLIEGLSLTPTQSRSARPVFDRAEARFARLDQVEAQLALLQVEATGTAQLVVDDMIAEIQPHLSGKQRDLLETCLKLSNAMSPPRLESCSGDCTMNAPVANL